MLHLIFQSPIDDALLQRIESLDSVVFFENAIFQINKNGILSIQFKQMLENRISLYVLDVELETRGLNITELVSGVKVINYSEFVELTEQNKVIKTWS
ncbi:MAG: sulfurtransferase complex subunit TusB [Methylococcales bacterium]